MKIQQVTSELQTAFCRECSQRMQRADQICTVLRRTSRPVSSLEKLHQEFDSLYGAARALNKTQLQEFFHLMRCYTRMLSRQLRDQIRNEPVDNTRLIECAIKIAMKSAQEISKVGAPSSNAIIDEFNQKIRQELKEEVA